MKHLKDKRLFLFDIDGTLAIGDTLLEGTAELLDYIARIRGRAIFITNNSTKSGRDYVERFQRVFGLTTTEDQFITSGYMTMRFLKEHYSHRKIYVMGTASFVQELRRQGLQITEDPEGDAACIVVAYDSELTYEKLVRTSRLLQTTDLPFYGTNPDLRCPIDFGFIPDCGTICNLLTETTGRRPTYLGKPSGQVVQYCLDQTGFTREETLVVGDRLYTDIACGINGGVDTCVLFTGEATPADLKDTAYPATYAFSNVKELLMHCTEAL